MKKDKYAIIVDRPEGGTVTVYNLDEKGSHNLENILRQLGLSYILCSEFVEVTSSGKRKYL